MGRFLQKDPSRLERNLYTYANGNPVNFTDPSGLLYINPQLQSLVDMAKSIYSKNGLSRKCIYHIDDGQYETDSVDDLFTDFICEYGPSYREFGHTANLTVELAHSKMISRLRAQFYFGGVKHYSGKGQMNLRDFFEAKFLDLSNGSTETNFAGFPIPVTVVDYLGGVDWEISRTTRGTVRFIIRDDKDLVSGTRIGFSRQGAQDISIERYLQQPQKYNRGNMPVANLALLDFTKYNIISVLSEKETRNPYKPDGLGGGTMHYVFKWEEKYEDTWGCKSSFIMYVSHSGQRLPHILDALPLLSDLLPAVR